VNWETFKNFPLLDLHGTDIQLINTEFEMKLLGKDGGAKKNNQSIEEAAPPPEHCFQCPCSIL
jgi:hypothetical protein